jgi:gluconolactonase
MSYPNGLAFSPDFKKLFVAETSTKRIWVGDWNESSSSWLNVEEFCYTGGSVGPDGIAIAENGFLYAAIYGSSQVKIFDQNGSLSGSILVPGKNPTNCAFDPFGKLGLVITESQQGNIFSYATNLTGTLHKL